MKKLILAVLLVLLPSLVWAAPAVMYVSDSGSSTSPYDTWAKAANEADFETDLEGSAEAGDIYYVLGGSTLTLDGSYNSAAQVGTAVAPISIIGVKAATTAEPPTYADWPAVGSADRPLFACTTHGFLLGDYYKVFNLIFTTTEASGARLATYGIFYNCKSTNSAVGANLYAFYMGNNSKLIACEAVSTAGRGALLDDRSVSLYSYFHDSDIGIYAPANNSLVIAFSVFDSMVTAGIYKGGADGCTILNNTFYTCPIAVQDTSAFGDVFINNIIDTATDGFLWTTQTDINFFWQNHEGNSVTDMWDLVAETMPHMDPTVTSGDPKFAGAAAGNFTLGSTSPNLDAAKGLELGDE